MTNEEKEEVRKQALFLTNMAYLLADMANSCAIDAESKLGKLGKCFQRDEKMRFKKAGKLAKAFGARVEIHRIEIPEKKRKFRKKPRKEQGNETR